MAVTLIVALLVAGECTANLLLRYRVGNYDYEYKSYVLWRVAPPHDGTIGVEDGLRRTTHSYCGTNAYTIWMFGGSGLWGNFNRDDETIPSYMARYFEESGHQVCIRNYGQRGWSNTQEVIQLMLDLKRADKKPNLVLFYDGTVDSNLPSESDEPDVHQGYLEFKRKFESWSPGREAGFSYLTSTNTYRALQWVAQKLDRGARQPAKTLSAEQLASIAARTTNNYLNNRNIVDALAVRYGFDYLFLVEPFLVTAHKPLAPEETRLVNGMKRGQPLSTQVMSAVYGSFRALNASNVVYLGDVFAHRTDRLFVDATHVGPRGSQLMAERICQILHQRGLPPQRD